MADRSLTTRGRRAGRALVAAGLLTTFVLGSPPWTGPHAAHAAAGHVAGVAAAQPRDNSATPTATPSATTGDTATAVTASPTGTITASVTVTGTATVTATATRPSTTSSRLSVVHRTNGYQVGTYYFSGWSRGPNDNLTPLLLTGPLRKYQPLIGWYDDSQSQVDKNITQAANAGIDFFAFDWYDTARSPYATDKSLNEALGYYLTSAQRHRMNFCLTFIDQAPFLPRASDWGGIVKTWISYFKQPDYVRVNGKPLLIIFSPEHMRGEIFGSSKNVHRALDYLRSAAIKAHLPGVTIAVGATLVPHYNPGRVGQLLTEGYDIATGYNYHAMGNEKYRTPVPYKLLVQENEQMWDRVARNLPLPYIPVITAGWDQRFSQREQSTAIVYAGRTPAQFACYAASARRWVDANAKRTVKERVVLVFAWNEIGEGGHIIPTQAERTGYIDALHHMFTVHQAPRC